MAKTPKNDFRWLIFILVLGLGACAAREAPQTTPAGISPSTAAQDRYCLRVLWVKDPVLMERIAGRLKQGESFYILAREAAGEGEKEATDRTGCLAASQIDPAILAAVRTLAPGQTAGPLKIKTGTVLVRVTTDAYFQQGKSHLEAGRYKEAEDALLKDLELNPDNVASWHLLGLGRMALGNNEGAVQALDKGLDFSPGSAALLNDKASALWSMNLRDQALANYRQALKSTPADPLILNNLAWALAQDGKDLAQAEALAKKAAEIGPNQPAFWDTLGQVQQKRGKHAQAVVSFHRALLLGKKTESTQKHLLASLRSLDTGVVSRLTSNDETVPSTQVSRRTTPAPAPSAGKTTQPPEQKRPGQSAPPATAPPPEPPGKGRDALAVGSPAKPSRPKEPEAPTRGAAEQKSPVLVLDGQPMVNLPPPDPSTLANLLEGEHTPGSGAESARAEALLPTAPPDAAREPQKPARGAGEPAPTRTETATSPDLKARTKVPAEAFMPVLAGAGQVGRPDPSLAGAKEIEVPFLPPRILASAEASGQAARPEPAGPPPGPAAPAVPSAVAGEPTKQEASAPQPPPTERKPPVSGREPEAPATAQVAPAPAVDKPRPGAAASPAGYYLQTSSFKHFDLANGEMSRWIKKGFPCHLEYINLGAWGKWYRVLLGPYPQKAQAEELGRRLKKEGALKEYLLMHKQR